MAILDGQQTLPGNDSHHSIAPEDAHAGADFLAFRITTKQYTPFGISQGLFDVTRVIFGSTCLILAFPKLPVKNYLP
jgi:hypothetical protein